MEKTITGREFAEMVGLTPDRIGQIIRSELNQPFATNAPLSPFVAGFLRGTYKATLNGKGASIVPPDSDAAMSDLAAKCARLESDLSEAVKKSATVTAKLKDAENERDNLRGEVRGMADSLRESFANNLEAAAKLKEVESAYCEADAKFGEMAAKCNGLGKQLQETEAKCANLKTDLGEAEKQLHETETALSEAKAKQPKIAELEAELTELNARLGVHAAEKWQRIGNRATMAGRGLIVALHVALWFFGLQSLAGEAGAWLGGMVAAFVAVGMVAMLNPKNGNTSGTYLLVFFFICLGGIWLDKQTFGNYFAAHFTRMDGTEGWVSFAFAVVAMGITWSMAAMNRQQIEENG